MPRRQGGRPTQEQSERLTGHVVDTATRLFLAGGYEATSIDQIADEANISKRTLYARFATKADLFSAVVSNFIATRVNGVHIPPTGNWEDRLTALVLGVLAIGTTDEAVALDRMVTAEVSRFPELGGILYEVGVRRALSQVQSLLQDGCKTGEIDVPDIEHTAEFLCWGLICGPIRRRVLGLTDSSAGSALQSRVRASIAMVLDGLRVKKNGQIGS